MTREEAIYELQYYMNSDCYLDAPSNEACQLAVAALVAVDALMKRMELIENEQSPA